MNGLNKWRKKLEEELALAMAKDVPTLLEELTQAGKLLVEYAMFCAVRVAALEAKGEALAGIAFLNELRRLAGGQMLPEVFARFEHLQSVIPRIALLPLITQEQLCSKGATVEVFTMTDAGPTERAIPVRELSKAQVCQVFTKTGEMRSLAQQRTYLEENAARAKRSEPATVHVAEAIEWNRRKDEVTISGTFDRASLLAQLATLRR